MAILPTPAGETGVGGVAASAQTIAATAYTTGTEAQPLPLSLYAYGRPTAGWSALVAPAQLSFTGGVIGGSIAATDRLVIAGDAPASPQNGAQAVVFVRPSRGWSGVVPASAILDSSLDVSHYGAGGEPVAVAGDAAFFAAGTTVDVFPQPAGGWAGAEQPAATLRIPNGMPITALAGSGDTVVAERGAFLYVFQQPAQGWSGALSPIARLRVPGLLSHNRQSLALSPSMIAVEEATTGDPAVFVFTKPPAGWKSSLAASRLQTTQFYNPEGGVQTAIAGRTVGVLESEPVVHTCPCEDTLFAATAPTTGWPATTTLSAVGAQLDNGNDAFAASGSDFVAVDDAGVHVYSPDATPALTATRLTDIAGNHPQLTLKVATGNGGSTLRHLVLHLPAGLHLNTEHAPRVAISGAHATVTAHRSRELVISITSTSRSVVTISLDAGTLEKSRAFHHELVKLFRAQRRPRPLRITIRTGLDSTLATATATSTFNIRRRLPSSS